MIYNPHCTINTSRYKPFETPSHPNFASMTNEKTHRHEDIFNDHQRTFDAKYCNGKQQNQRNRC